VFYLDQVLAEGGLLRHKVEAYVDDLVFIANSRNELETILDKLKSIGKFLEVNQKKSGIMVCGGKDNIKAGSF
jgi:hypothetical protein